MNDFAAYLGIDWADRKYDLCEVDASTGQKSRLVLKHTPETIAEYFSALRTRYGGPQDRSRSGAITWSSNVCAFAV